MRYILALPVLLAFAASSPAVAQMYPGQDITVNPSAAGTQVLLYPGGKYGRVVHHLRMPGDDASGPIHLHMPARHRLARHIAPHPTELATAAPSEPAALPPPVIAPPIATPIVTAPPAAVHTARKHTAPAARVKPAETAPVGSMSDLEDFAAAPPAAPPAAKPERKPPPQRMASVEPPPVRPAPTRSAEPVISGSRKSIIVFAAGASDPAVSAVQNVKSLAGDLATALVDGSTRVQLLAYGGQPGEKSSDSRRLSLKRALIIRQLLIDDGVPAERIDVRAMGGADDGGPPDRVDVFVKS